MYVLVTGATGKVGSHFIKRFLKENSTARIRALCHNRSVDEHERVDIVRGSISDRDVCRQAMQDITHIVHLATCKEIPEDVMDVTVKGMFWLLEEARESKTFERFVLVGGDASVGHFVYERKDPITEDQAHKPYPGCYALSKVLEEVMLQQYVIQYDLDTCCLRAPWIMEKDDFKYSMAIGDEQFGRPLWSDLMGQEEADRCADENIVPILCNIDGEPLQRNFVHVDDLVSAIITALDHPQAKQELFHICMDEPVDYGVVAEHLKTEYGIDHVRVRSDKHSTWLDNSKAKFKLGWRPQYNTKRLIDESWTYQREADDARKIWYPG